MINITAHNIEMYSHWEKEVSYRRETRLTKMQARLPRERDNGDQLEITPRARRMLENSGTGKVKKEEEYFIPLSEEDLQKIKILEEFLSRLTGKEFKIKIPVMKKITGGEARENETDLPGRELWQVEFELHESYQEKEELNFSSRGVVKTADGQEIDFEVELNMSRELMMENNLKIQAGGEKPIDPLIINYGGRAADFKETTFKFDLTANGSKEILPLLQEGSGFLVVVDEGEKIKDGSQLFGPETGEGFKELAAHDEDNNSWIDSGDSIFDKLRIWTRDANGNDRLFALTDKNIGAIYLGHLDAPYSQKDDENRTLAANKKMGMFLRENGRPGTVQEVDFVV